MNQRQTVIKARACYPKDKQIMPLFEFSDNYADLRKDYTIQFNSWNVFNIERTSYSGWSYEIIILRDLFKFPSKTL